jgi:hypothetical protein
MLHIINDDQQMEKKWIDFVKIKLHSNENFELTLHATWIQCGIVVIHHKVMTQTQGLNLSKEFTDMFQGWT